MAGKIFINYRRDDSIGMAGRLHDRFAHVFGRDKLFMDVDHIPAGTDFVAHLNSQVAECDVLLVVIGSNWLGLKDESGGRRLDNPDDFVAIEIAAALDRDIRVIPVLVDGTRMPKASELPESLKPLARRHAVDIRHAHFGHDAEALVARMREALGDDAAGTRRRRVRAVIGAAAVAVLLLIGWGGSAFIQHMLTTVEQTVQLLVAAVKAGQEWQVKAAAEAEAKRKNEEAERQRLLVVAAKAEQEGRARAAAEAGTHTAVAALADQGNRASNPDSAIATYGKALELDPNFASGFLNRGVAYGNKGDQDRAIADYNEAIRLDPKYAIAFYNRGTAYGNKGRPRPSNCGLQRGHSTRSPVRSRFLQTRKREAENQALDR